MTHKAPARQSNFELLRILLMLMIVANHLRGGGGFEALPSAPLSRALLYLLCSGGKVAVDCFVLISGYFMCTSSAGWRPKRLLKLYLQVFFYSAGVFAALAAAGLIALRPENIVAFFLPVSQNTYWFATCYLFLMLLAPFLNKLAQGLERAEYRRFLLIGAVIIALVPTVLVVKYPLTNMMLLLYVYLLAGYVRLHPEPLFGRRWLALGVAAGCYLLMVGYTFAYGLLLPKLPLLRFMPKQIFSPGNSVPALLCALGLFLFFKDLKVKGSRVINVVASATFGVYLLHDHSPRMREFLWLEFFDSRPFFARPAAFAARILLVPLAVFAVGVAVDLLRQYALERPLFRLIDKTKFGKKYLHD